MRTTIILLLIFLLTIGCGDHLEPVDPAPSAPSGVYSITGDGKVELFWDHNPEPDVDIYAVYSSNEEFGRYELEGTTASNYYRIYMPNGITRYFAVAAIDYSGNESELSYETVWDTPRPEGRGLTVYPLFYDEWETNSNRCALDFSDYMDYMIQSIDNNSNDVYFDNYEGIIYINTFDDDTDIALFGYASSLEDVDYIDPDMFEWNSDGYLELMEDFAYVVWTWDNHFAVVRVQEVYQDMVILEWAYQTEQGNPQVKRSGGSREENRTLKQRIPKNNRKSQE